MRKLLFITLLIQIIQTFPAFAERTDALLDSLDYMVAHKSVFVQNKERRIEQLKRQPAQSDMDRYSLSKFLFHEYATFDSDSALFYGKRCLTLSRKLSHSFMTRESHLLLALIYTDTGIFDKARLHLEQVERPDELPYEVRHLYWEVRSLYYYHLAEYIDDDSLAAPYLEEGAYSRRMLLESDSIDQLDLLWHQVENMNKTGGNIEPLLSEVRQALGAPERIDTQSMARLYFSLAIYKKQAGEKDWLEMMIRAALTDLKAANRDELALQTVALELFRRGDIERAYRYIHSTLDDALYYKNRIRFSRLADIQSIIYKEYEKAKEEQNLKLLRYVIAIGLLMFLVVGTSLLVVGQKRRIVRDKHKLDEANSCLNRQLIEIEKARGELDQTNTRLKRTVELLSESNYVKETYIAQMFTLCSAYIDRMNEIRVTTGRKLKAGQTKDVLKYVETETFTSDMLKDFYYRFDTIFLHIYPNFVTDFNKLLREEEQIVPKKSELLTSELRIYALIRLGITNRIRIAEMLHYSPQTVYNYQTRTRSRLINPAWNLEEIVRFLGTPSQE